MIYDTFVINDEMDMLECRLVELCDLVDRFVLVEAAVTHQGGPKPLHYTENRARFAPWADQIIHVVADLDPDDPNPWTRERAQREWIAKGLADADADDLIYQSDVDEIPRRDVVDVLRPRRPVVLAQSFRCFAVDWVHPQAWTGTVACRAGQVTSFAAMRDLAIHARGGMFSGPVVPHAGWHFSWVGGPEQWAGKLGAFAHPEVAGWVPDEGLGWYFREGVHVDGTKLARVDDDDYPEWVRAGNAPASWWRHR